MNHEPTEQEELLLYVNAEQGDQIARLTALVATLRRDLHRAQRAAAETHDAEATE